MTSPSSRRWHVAPRSAAALPLLALLACLQVLAPTALAAGGNGTRLKVSGVLEGGVLVGTRVVRRDASKRADSVRLQGLLQLVDAGTGRLRIGGVEVMLAAQGPAIGALPVGQVVEADGTRTPAGTVIDTIELASDGDAASTEVIGVVEHETRLPDGDHTLLVGGVPVRLPRALYGNGQPRTQRLDDRRPEQQLTTTLWGRRLVIGGEAGVDTGLDVDRRLGSEEDDERISTQQELQVEAFLAVSDEVSAFAEFKAQRETDHHRGRDETDHETRVERGEAWLLWEQVGGSPFSVQVGRQNFGDEREWWWDEDLDAVRVSFERGRVHAELALAQELAPVNLRVRRIDPEQKEVRRLLGNLRWQALPRTQLAAFLLLQRDASDRFAIGRRLPSAREDELDADLDWFGLRAIGDADLGFVGLSDLGMGEVDLAWWVDLAWMRGREVRVGFDDHPEGGSVVEDIERMHVRGHAIDLGASLTLPFSWEPTLTLGWARGSGSRRDGAFRQTGLNDNNWKFNGVDRFRYYGEVARPALSNIAIATLALGGALGPNSSIEVLLHDYRRVARDGPEPDLRLNGDFGEGEHVGRELDVVLGLEAGAHWELELTAGLFAPGNAWARDNRDTAAGLVFKVNYNF